MKTTLFIPLFLLIFISSAEAQVDPALKDMQLYESSEYITYGHRITLEFSELEFHMGVGVFPKTNIAYLTYKQLIALMQDTAKRENWDQERYIKSRNYLYNNAKGGRIVLYVERYDQYNTNNKLFFVIIRDMEGDKLFEHHLPYRAADLISTEKFSNWAHIDIDTELPDKFSVFVNNKTTERLSDTKFVVEKNAAPLVKPKKQGTKTENANKNQ